jgi:hypothetical protein
MRTKFLVLAAVALLFGTLLIAWPTIAQQPRPSDTDLAARLDRIEKQLAQIQDQLKKMDGPKGGWQKVKESDRSVTYMDSVTGKIKFVYVDGTDRVVDK